MFETFGRVATGMVMVILILLNGVIQAGSTEAKPVMKRNEVATATFAGGCFWCMEPPFDALEGVVATVSGYTGGSTPNPTYEDVSSGGTGHMEALQVLYDPMKVSYTELLDIFWRNIDPTDAGGQFVDRGAQYRSAIFYHDAEQKQLAETSRVQLAASGRFRQPLTTQILPAGPFYPAEEYHQDYYRKNPIRYKFYRYNSGRDQFLGTIWGKAKK